ncbi:MAG: lycopene cyclase domain-containing protein [Bacteroidetes bacterium]|nr:MAG: lycopene cyclase domain-containing protein [Bacteroidota bacterium]
MSTYLLLDLLTLAGPLALSFDKKVAFYKNWKYLFPAILITAVFFLVWDYFFTLIGIWEFNPEYVMNIRWGGMPVEEYLFFLVVPYACVFIYECLKAYSPKDYLFKLRHPLSLGLFLFCAISFYFYPSHLYTAINAVVLGTLLLLLYWKKSTGFLGMFYFAYLVALIPFAIVNGILTSMPVLVYNDAANLGIRVGSIPLDDFFYNLIMLLMTVSLYEYFKNRK